MSLFNHCASTQEELKQSMARADTLSLELKSQRNFCMQQEKIIDYLKSDMRSKNAHLLDNSIQCLQAAISEKDSSMALLEMQGTASLKNRSGMHNLRQEKNKLMKELKEKVRVNGLRRSKRAFHIEQGRFC